jgi:hypothetical protein
VKFNFIIPTQFDFGKIKIKQHNFNEQYNIEFIRFKIPLSIKSSLPVSPHPPPAPQPPQPPHPPQPPASTATSAPPTAPMAAIPDTQPAPKPAPQEYLKKINTLIKSNFVQWRFAT